MNDRSGRNTAPLPLSASIDHTVLCEVTLVLARLFSRVVAIDAIRYGHVAPCLTTDRLYVGKLSCPASDSPPPRQHWFADSIGVEDMASISKRTRLLGTHVATFAVDVVSGCAVAASFSCHDQVHTAAAYSLRCTRRRCQLQVI